MGATATVPDLGTEQPGAGNPVTQFPPGAVAPREVGNSEASPRWGYFGEKLPDRVKKAIRTIFTQLQTESYQPRREEIQRIQQAREFWRGLQWQYWSAIDGQWHLPFSTRKAEETAAADEPRYMFVTNYYQAFGLILISVLSQDVPATRLRPQSAQSADDIAYAKAGTDIIDIVQRNNRMPELMAQAGFFLFTDGKLGGYVRYVLDGERWGFHPEEEYETRQVKVGFDQYDCPNCGQITAAKDYQGACSQCGAPMGPECFSEAPLANVPLVKQTHQFPNGAELITMVGGLELKTPSYCNEFWEFPYLIWEFEVHKTRLKAAYPHARKRIDGAPTDAGNEENGTNERLARLSVKTGGNTGIPRGYGEQNLTTYSRGWFRSWSYELIENDVERAFLYKWFPDGLYCAYAGGSDVLLEARNERMADHWRVMHCFPGDGQDRPGLGTSFISVQERINTVDNLMVEKIEYGVPTTYANPGVLDFDSIPGTTVEPGSTYPTLSLGQGAKVADGFHTVAADAPNEAEFKYREELSGPVGQFLTGAFPALFGGDPDTDTVGGTVIQRDQAMGRLGVVWRGLKYFISDLMLLSVECWRKNRPDDYEEAQDGPAGSFRSKWIRKADLKGNLCAAPETDEHFPTVWSQQRNILLQLMQSEDPHIAQILTHPDNLSMVKDLIGLEELVIPDQETRDKQYSEIDELLHDQPTMELDPQTGQPTLKSSVPVDPQMDDHAIEWEVCFRWCHSAPGLEEKKENPLGYANVRAHALEHQAILQQNQGSQQKPPSESINFKDLPPDGQVQMAGQAGIKLDPMILMAKTAAENKAKQQPKKPAPGGASNASA